MDALNKSVNLLEELDNLSKLHILERDEIDQIMIDFATRITHSLRIERMSVWIFNNERNAIVSLGEYDIRTKKFQKDRLLYKADYPDYFSTLEENRIVIAGDVINDAATRELGEDYLKKYQVCSLMDVPIRIAGEVVGVMCFEKCHVKKQFTSEEQSFGLSLAIVFASNLEARHRRTYQSLLEKSLSEKDMLIKEINHRVRNNFAILISLMRLSRERGNTVDPKVIFTEYEQRINSMLKIQDLLYETKNYTEINVADYISELAVEFRKTNAQMNNAFEIAITKSEMLAPTKTAIHLGLIISEIFLNSIKYALPNNPEYSFKLELKEISSQKSLQLVIGDNGKGFSFDSLYEKNTLGLPLIKDLCDSINVDTQFPKQGNAYYMLVLKP
jgi:two-component sensor histidine kinase